MKAPGFEKVPQYAVEFEEIPETVRVFVGAARLAQTNRALRVLETRHDPVVYVPIADIDRDLLRESETETYCPFKGKARYWSVAAAGETVTDAIWSYPDPYDECARLKGYAAFYTDKVRLEIAAGA